MKIFISSVRAGLESERDALPGLIKALGHDPVRFEDFTAQPVPSRQACIEAVESSDLYLLLLGAHYGHTFPETGQSATQDEWTAAQRLGLPRYVFRKTGIELDAAQANFEAMLGDYGSGRFYKTFADVSDLQTAVAAAIRDVESAPDPLNFQPLAERVSVRWLNDSDENRGYGSSQPARLEVHVIPVGGKPLSGRLLEQILLGLPGHVRASGLVSATEALDASHGVNEVTLSVPTPSGARWGDLRSGSLSSVRVHDDGEMAIVFRLPGDQMGSIVDPQDVAVRVASALRLAGQVDLSAADKIALGVGLTTMAMVTVGEVRQSPRNSASVTMNDSAVRVEPDETMTRAALDRGADEVAAAASRSLLRAFISSPRW